MYIPSLGVFEAVFDLVRSSLFERLLSKLGLWAIPERYLPVLISHPGTDMLGLVIDQVLVGTVYVFLTARSFLFDYPIGSLTLGAKRIGG